MATSSFLAVAVVPCLRLDPIYCAVVWCTTTGQACEHDLPQDIWQVRDALNGTVGIAASTISPVGDDSFFAALVVFF